MNVQFDFLKKEDRDNIVAQQKARGFRLIEEQYHSDGKHLIFTDEPPEAKTPPLRNLSQELDDLKAILKAKGII